jgi:hypothetical protein
MRRKVPSEIWEQVKTAFAAGIALREVARNMNLPAGTILARAKREGWTKQIQAAKQALTPVQSTAITPMQSAALSMHQRGQRHLERMANVSEKVVSHVETLAPGMILDRVDDVEKLDRIARRTYGLNEQEKPYSPFNLSVLSQNTVISFQTKEEYEQQNTESQSTSD